jgi:hypothetical protein
LIESISKVHKLDSAKKKKQTVPSLLYTAVPHAAMRASTSHMINDSPTLPDDWRMLLGIAYILFQTVHFQFHIFTTTHPLPITELKIRKIALKRPAEWLLFSSNTAEDQLR